MQKTRNENALPVKIVKWESPTQTFPHASIMQLSFNTSITGASPLTSAIVKRFRKKTDRCQLTISLSLSPTVKI